MLKEIASGRSDIFNVDPRRLSIKPGMNSRNFDDPENIEHIDTLARSIAEVGVKEPLTVFTEGDVVYVSDGECRLRAAIRAIEHYQAELRTIPVKTEGRHASEADRVFSQIVRNSGKQFTPLEQSRVFKRLVDLGWSTEEISRKSGRTAAYVNRLLELQAAPREIVRMVERGEVSATLAVETLKSEEAPTETLTAAVETARTKGRTRATRKDIPSVKKPTPQERVLALGDMESLVSLLFDREEALTPAQCTEISEQWSGKAHDALDVLRRAFG